MLYYELSSTACTINRQPKVVLTPCLARPSDETPPLSDSTTTALPTRTNKATRRDVAEAAGVSVTTVTHALNPDAGGRVNAETADRVRRVARDMGYRPNFVGRALVSGRNMAVGVVLPDHSVHPRHQLYQDILYGLAEAMQPDDYVPVIILESARRSSFPAVDQGRVDGLFALTSSPNDGAIPRLIDSGMPAVVVNKDWVPGENPLVGCVRSDHEQMIRDAVRELVKLGCRNLMLCIDTRYIDANRLVHAAFVRSCRDYREQGVIGSVLNPFDEDDCHPEIRNALACGVRWDGVITDKFSQAQAVFDEVQAVGMVPNRDIHVITANTEEGVVSPSRLERTCFTQDPVAVGTAAWRLMKRMLDGDTPEERVIRVPYNRYPVAREPENASRP